MAGDTTIEAPQMSPQEKQLQAEQLKILQQQQGIYENLMPLMASNLGLIQDPNTGEYRQMTPEEYQSSLTPLQQQAYDVQSAAYDRLMKAYAGELEVSPQLESDLQEQQKMIEERLSRSLGPNWMNSTAGQQAMSEFQTKAELLREEARRGILGQGSQNYLGSLGATSGLSGQQTGSLQNLSLGNLGALSGYSQAQQPYQYYNNLDFQADAANAQMNAQKFAGLMGGLGSLTGAGITAWGLK